MNTIARFLSARNADYGLSLSRKKSGFSLITSEKNASAMTSSVVGQLVTPQLLEAHFAAHIECETDVDAFVPEFDPLHQSLQAAVFENSWEKIQSVSNELLSRNVLRKASRSSGIFPEIFEFYSLRAKLANFAERRNFAAQFAAEDVESFLKSAPKHVDVLRSQVLALAALGELWNEPNDPVAQIRAYLAFTCQAIERKTAVKRTPKEKAAVSAEASVSVALGAPFFLPGFVFEIDHCVWPNQLSEHNSKEDKSGDATDPNGADTTRAAGASHAVAMQAQDKPRRGGDAGDYTANAPTDPDYYFIDENDGNDPTCGCECDEPECAPTEECCGDIN